MIAASGSMANVCDAVCVWPSLSFFQDSVLRALQFMSSGARLVFSPRSLHEGCYYCTPHHQADSCRKPTYAFWVAQCFELRVQLDLIPKTPSLHP